MYIYVIYMLYIVYKCKLSFFESDDTKQAKSLIFIEVPEAEQVPKVKKKKMLDVIGTYNNSNYKLT